MSSRAAAPWRSTALITLGAAAVLGLYCLLPSGGRLTHMDFLADNATVLELCNPLNALPPPVVTGSRLPVTMSLVSIAPAQAGEVVRGTFELRSISGKAVTPADLRSIAGRKIRLTVRSQVYDTDSAPRDQYHRPDPFNAVGVHPGQWDFSFRPSGPGPYRITAEFTPVSTGKPLEASVDGN
jgi:hypothetical protein